MARILKVKKSWYIDYNLDGKRIKKVIGRSKRIAELALSDIEAKIRPIPILSEIPAGHPKDYNGFPSDIVEEYYRFKVEEQDPDAFLLRVEGDCMAPEIKKGDLLLITPNETVESGDIAAVVNGKGEKEVTRITIRKDEIILTPDNPAYPTIVWEGKDKPKIIGRVKEIIRRR